MENLKKILVVDDETNFRRVIAIRLKAKGYSVIEAEDGKHGLEKIKNENPDLIILDLLMPNINGFELCKMLQSDEKYKSIPIIVVSALSKKNEEEWALNNGADAFFTKPFDWDILHGKIQDLIGS